MARKGAIAMPSSPKSASKPNPRARQPQRAAAMGYAAVVLTTIGCLGLVGFVAFLHSAALMFDPRAGLIGQFSAWGGWAEAAVFGAVGAKSALAAWADLLANLRELRACIQLFLR
jgi:hypothetical protein